MFCHSGFTPEAVVCSAVHTCTSYGLQARLCGPPVGWLAASAPRLRSPVLRPSKHAVLISWNQGMNNSDAPP